MPEVEYLVHTHKRNCIDGLTDLARQAGAVDSQPVGYQLAVPGIFCTNFRPREQSAQRCR